MGACIYDGELPGGLRLPRSLLPTITSYLRIVEVFFWHRRPSRRLGTNVTEYTDIRQVAETERREDRARGGGCNDTTIPDT